MHLGGHAVTDHLPGEVGAGITQGIEQPIGECAVALPAIKGIFKGGLAGAAGGKEGIAFGFKLPVGLGFHLARDSHPIPLPVGDQLIQGRDQTVSRRGRAVGTGHAALHCTADIACCAT